MIMSTRAITYVEETQEVIYVRHDGNDESNILIGDSIKGSFDFSKCKSQEDIINILLEHAIHSDLECIYFLKKNYKTVTSKLKHWEFGEKKPDDVIKIGWFGDTKPHPVFGNFGWTAFK